jgi:CheY-like chemotaxis protein
MATKPVILCVDDERNVVESMELNLRKLYQVKTALSGAEGLEILRAEKEVAVVLSDMRMPEMDGAAFLSAARAASPDTVRILLTGFADIEAAVRAVNDGQIFRFLTKPCSPENLLAALAAGMEQHRLITAERVLLQKTLVGSVKALIEVLALSNPLALGRAVRIRDRARKAVRQMSAEKRWQVEFAAMLSQLGAVSLPEEVTRKLYDGETLDRVEQSRLAESMGAVNDILSHIPRLEPVTSVLDELKGMIEGYSAAGGAARPSEDARLLQAVIDLDALEAQGRSLRTSIDMLSSRRDLYGEDVLAALRALANDPTARQAVTVEVTRLREGMVLAEDLKTTAGVLIVPRGFELNQSSLEHILNFDKQLVSSVRVFELGTTVPAVAKGRA